MNAASSPLALPLARKVAEAHAEVGLVEFNALQGVIDAARREGRDPDFFRLVRHGVPAVTNLTLALELLLKVLSYQHHGSYPHGHNLALIVTSLPSVSVDRMRRDFARLHSEPREFRAVRFDLAIAPGTSPHPQPPSEAGGALFDTALANADGAYQTWRYLYEDICGNNIGVDFRSLLFLIEAVHSEIRNFEGNAKAVMGSDKSIVLSRNNALERERGQ